MHQEYSGLTSDHIKPSEARGLLVDQYGNVCLRCGFAPTETDPVLAVDHITPVARGGQNRYRNYQLLCGPCNSWKRLQIIDYRPGPPRGLLRDDVPIVPHGERVRGRNLKIVPSVPAAPPEVIKVQVPILVPTPPPAHNCYDALPRLYHDYNRISAEMTRFSERCGRAEATVQEMKLAKIGHDCGMPVGCFVIVVFLFLIAISAAVYFYIYGRAAAEHRAADLAERLARAEMQASQIEEERQRAADLAERLARAERERDQLQERPWWTRLW
jgi:hypothetical protein